MPRAPSVFLTLAACLTAVSCSSGAGIPPPTATTPPTSPPAGATTAPTTNTTPTTPSTAPTRDCAAVPRPLPPIPADADAAALSLLISAATFTCADEVTVAPADDTTAGARAAAHAAAAGGPLLLAGPDTEGLAAEIRRLDPRLVTVSGAVDPDHPAFSARPVAALTGTAAIRADIVWSAKPRRLLVVGEGASTVWPAVWAAARAAGDVAILIGPGDVRAAPALVMQALRSSGTAPAHLIGAHHEDIPWQVEVVRSGRELPGGGLLLFPGRRLVAFYGSPETPLLGVLGEQGPNGAEATLDRMMPFVAEYSSDGVLAVPTFEIIATIADAEPTPDGDYSRETPLEVLRPWVETAGERGAYVILDLQPGRTDFLTQARMYEEFLRLPHVGLALDPEWRLRPDQFHLRQIGSVGAAEINEVAEWLAGIVRDEALPQKALILHQFRLDMIPDRSEVALHPELAIVVHMDGQGPLAAKYVTWSVLTGRPDAELFWWGWKNFFDEDVPMARPPEVLSLDPPVVFVSFQ